MVEYIFPHSYSAVLKELRQRLKEPAPGRIQILSGPRQVGKTHLLRKIEAANRGKTIYAAADTPASAIPGWWEAQWRMAEQTAESKKNAILLLDEVQYLPNWSKMLKAEYDRIEHLRIPIHVVVSGSSSLKLGHGTRETMAGRFERLQLSHWPPRELSRHFSLSENRALNISLTLGTYPGAVPYIRQTERWRQYIQQAIIEPAVGRDIMTMETIRKPMLLRQLFALAANNPAEIISLQKLQGNLQDAGALETVAHYLHVLEQAYLVAALEKFSMQAIRRRSSPPKLVVLNQGILGAFAADSPNDIKQDSSKWGRWVENACIALAWNAGQKLHYWRSEPFEVDFIITGSWGKWAVEVKTGKYETNDLRGLFEFSRRYPEYRPLLLCDKGRENTALKAGIACQPWREFLLNGPPM